MSIEKEAFKAGMIAMIKEVSFELMGTRTVPAWIPSDDLMLDRLFATYKEQNHVRD